MIILDKVVKKLQLQNNKAILLGMDSFQFTGINIKMEGDSPNSSVDL